MSVESQTYYVGSGMIPLAAGTPQGRPADDDDFWYAQATGDGPAASGIVVSAEKAIQVATVYACVSLIADTVGMTAIHIYKRQKNNDRERVKPSHKLQRLLNVRPNDWQTPFEFKQMIQGHLCLRGNGYAEKIFNRRTGEVDQLIPRHPDRMEAYKLSNGRMGYTWRPLDGKPVKFIQDEIVHFRGFTWDGITGLNPIQYLRESVGTSLAAEAFAGTFFRNMARPSGIIKHPGKLGQQARENLRDSFQQRYGAGNYGKVAVFEEGMEFQALSVAAKDMEFIEQRKFGVTEICKIFRVLPFMIGETEKSTSWGTGIEEQGIGFRRYTLMPWFTRWESVVLRDLVDDDVRYFAEFNADSLERADLTKRTESFAKRFQNGATTINEWRRAENMPPTDGDYGDKHYVQAQMVALEDGVPVGPAAKPSEPPPPDDQPDDTTPPDDQEDDGEDDTNDSTDSKASAVQEFVPLIEDAASRIVSAEIGSLRSRAEKATGDLDRFRAWYAEQWVESTKYLAKVLAPIAATWERRTASTVDLVSAADASLDAGRLELSESDDPARIVEEWQRDGSRAHELALAIVGALEGSIS